MNVNHLLAVPEPETLDLLKELFKSTPIEPDWEHAFIEIGSREGPINTHRPSSVYYSFPGSMNVWYDTSSGRSNLLLPLIPSPKMARRHNEIGDAWGRPLFRPVLYLGVAPNLRRRHRAMLNSVATALVDTCPVLGFGSEFFEKSEHGVALFADFYRDYVERGTISNQALLESDEGID